MVTASGETGWEAQGRSWWSHVRVLADDSMEGRDTGSAGYQRAADYVVEQFRAAGVEPAGVDGFRQPVDFVVSQLDEASSSLTLIRNGVERPLKLREEAQFSVTSETAPDLEAGAVFVGYGLEIPEHEYSDLAGLDLRGKVAVAFLGGPADLPGPVKAHYQSAKEAFRALRRAGAVGALVMLNPKVPDLPWPRMASGLLFPTMELRDNKGADDRPLPFLAVLNHEQFDLLLEGSGHTAGEMIAPIGGPGPLPRFPLNVRLRAHVAVRRSAARCTNVIGILRGTDPALRDEFVVGSAHLDHLGIGEPINGDSIYSGAMDNASGVAALIEIARAIKNSGARPKRSLLFAVVTGEEKGLLGSEYFAKHPTVSGRIVANLNVDMFLPLFPLTNLEVQGLNESSLGPELREVAGKVGVETDAEYLPDRQLFIRSDQYNFVKAGVPALEVAVGYRSGSDQEAAVMEFFSERYHAPADDIDQPVDLTAAAQFIDIVRRMMLQVANDLEPPRWNADSFFRKFGR